MPPAAVTSHPADDQASIDLPRPRSVLLVEDDPIVAEVVTTYLRRAGHAVAHVADGVAALERAAAEPPDLVVLDRMLPGIDGLEVCRRLRASRPVPVILLTALGEEEDRIRGLEAGADDYLVKPFSPRELVLRVDAILRRSVAELDPPAVLEVGPFRLDVAGRSVSRDGAELPLTTREFDLLAFLLRHPNQVFRREVLLKNVWEWDIGDLSTVTVHVRRLREKIEADPTAPRHLVTVWGTGYRFDVTAGE